MGLNSTVLIRNDMLNEVEKDPKFGENLFRAINQGGFPRDVPAKGASNAATVVEVHHNTSTSVVAIGGGTGTVLGAFYGSSHDPLVLLKYLAQSLGFRLVRLPKGK